MLKSGGTIQATAGKKQKAMSDKTIDWILAEGLD